MLIVMPVVHLILILSVSFFHFFLSVFFFSFISSISNGKVPWKRCSETPCVVDILSCLGYTSSLFSFLFSFRLKFAVLSFPLLYSFFSFPYELPLLNSQSFFDFLFVLLVISSSSYSF